MEVDTIIFLHTLFLYKSKLYKKNETEIGETYKQIRTFWGQGVQKQKIKVMMIYISFKNLLTKEWPEHRQSQLFIRRQKLHPTCTESPSSNMACKK